MSPSFSVFLNFIFRLCVCLNHLVRSCVMVTVLRNALASNVHVKHNKVHVFTSWCGYVLVRLLRLACWLFPWGTCIMDVCFFSTCFYDLPHTSWSCVLFGCLGCHYIPLCSVAIPSFLFSLSSASRVWLCAFHSLHLVVLTCSLRS